MQAGKHRISGQVAGAVLVFMGCIFMFAALQRQLIYFPETAAEGALLDAAEHSGLQAWRDRDGQLIGWQARTPGESRHRLVVFHGNAGHALYRQYFAAGFLSLAAGWQVYLFEYPGYGARPGSPSESGIKAAASSAIEALLAEDARPVYLVGESLGSGVATYLASTFGTQISGLLLVTPFTSLADVAGHHYGGLPAKALLRERYDSTAALDQYRGPVATTRSCRQHWVASCTKGTGDPGCCASSPGRVTTAWTSIPGLPGGGKSLTSGCPGNSTWTAPALNSCAARRPLTMQPITWSCERRISPG